MTASIENFLYKSPIQRNLLKRSSCIVTEILSDLASFINPGCTGTDIETFVLERIHASGATAVSSAICNFPSSISINPNSVAAHGVPNKQPLEDGEIVTVDIILEKGGWYGDAAWTYCIGTCDKNTQNLQQMAWKAAITGVNAVQIGKPLRVIGDAIYKEVSKYGYSVLPECAGHGLGRSLHEPPVVHLTAGGSKDEIQDGMVFTIEPVIIKGGSVSLEQKNVYELHTSDLRNTAQFELTVAVNKHGVEILNSKDNDFRFCINPPF